MTLSILKVLMCITEVYSVKDRTIFLGLTDDDLYQTKHIERLPSSTSWQYPKQIFHYVSSDGNKHQSDLGTEFCLTLYS